MAAANLSSCRPLGSRQSASIATPSTPASVAARSTRLLSSAARNHVSISGLAASTPANPCWRDTRFFDAFDAEGRYLGEIQGLSPYPWFARPTIFARGDMVVAPQQDDAGTIMVKRYRLVLPGEEER